MRFVVPDEVVEHMHVRAGDVVADFGAGSGYFIPTLAAAVGPEGKVYACEIQKQLVDTLGEIARDKGLANVDPLWCDLEAEQGTKLADNTLDVGLLVNTLFQLEEKNTALEELKRVLRPGAKLFVVDWSESFQGLGPTAEHVVTEADARALFETAGFTFERTIESGAHHYGLAFRL